MPQLPIIVEDATPCVGANATSVIYVSATGYAATDANLTWNATTGLALGTGNLTLVTTTTATTGIIYKGTSIFIHNFQHPTGGGAVPVGGNTFVGVDAGNLTMGSTATQTSHGSYNSVVGYQALLSNTTGYRNSAMGANAMLSNTTGFDDAAMGESALRSNLTGFDNAAMGAQALYYNTTGNYNSAVGNLTLYSNTTASNNSALGAQALFFNTEGYDNSAVGKSALRFNGTGYSNSAMGVNALGNNSVGYSNCALGVDALRYNSTGYQNAAMGVSGLYYNTVGNYNTAAGSGAGSNPSNDIAQYRIVDDTYITLVGYGATKNNAATLTNSTAIGNGALVTASNQVVIGNDSVTQTLLRGNLGIGQVAFDATGVKVVALGNGTAPAAGLTDAAQIYSADQTAGNACFHTKTELGDVIKLYKQAHIADAAGGTEIATINAILAALENLGLLATS